MIASRGNRRGEREKESKVQGGRKHDQWFLVGKALVRQMIGLWLLSFNYFEQ